MNITITIKLNMDDAQMKAWAREYGLNTEEVASDATHHIGELVREHVEAMPHVEEFTTVKSFQVK